MAGLVWFKNDYRTQDHTPLTQACAHHDVVIGLVFDCTTQWKRHDYSERRLSLRQKAIANLHRSLQRLNIPLIHISCDTFADCPSMLIKVCQQLAIKRVYANREYALNERQRDHACQEAAAGENIAFYWSDDQMIVPPEVVLTHQGTPYRVFSSFKKNWVDKYHLSKPFGTPRPRHQLAETGKWPTAHHLAIHEPDSQLEKKMLEQLDAFSTQSMSAYNEQRDIPSVRGTSELSAAFSLGIVSPHRAAFLAHNHPPSKGATTWMNELAWRDFFRYIVFHYPWVCKGHAFNRQTDTIIWNDNPQLLEAWVHGKTGIPLVDAGMRQLAATGWMHNRVRMVTAMFLTKNCFINWRQGEKYFMQQLVDGDFPSNNGGWQWSASTGVDAAPYFRIFNPVQQAKRFDENADYIRQWIPELAKVDTRTILRIGEEHGPTIKHYPAPVVDLKASRQYAIERFKAAT